MPIGRMEVSIPVFNPSAANFAFNDGKIDPRDMNIIPNKKRPTHAAAKT